MKGIIYECKTINEMQSATDKLDKAKIVPLKIDDGGVLKDVVKRVGIYNISQGQFCEAVVPHYNLIQHKEYFDGFATALKRLNLKFTMTLKSSGNRAFADIDFIGRNIKYKKLGEEFTTGIRLMNSYDKSTGLFVMPRFTRLACTNGMILTRNEKTVSIKHHSKVVKEIGSFIELKIGSLITKYDDLQTWVSGSMKDSIEWKTACYIIEKLFSQIKHREEILKRLNISIITVTDKKSKKKSVNYIWDSDVKKKKKLTRWEIYNAMTQYISHGEHITPHIENHFHHLAEKLLITPLIKMPKVEVTL